VNDDGVGGVCSQIKVEVGKYRGFLLIHVNSLD
jgi:hypothetical protein